MFWFVGLGCKTNDILHVNTEITHNNLLDKKETKAANNGTGNKCLQSRLIMVNCGQRNVGNTHGTNGDEI